MTRAMVMAGAIVLLAGCGQDVEAQKVRAEMHVGEVRKAVAMHLLLTTKLPATLDDLKKPLKDYPDGLMPDANPDPWGHPLQYEPSGERKFTLRSLGADGRPGGTGADEDIDSDSLRR